MLVDELVDGAKGAALPLIRHDLGLSYGQIGLLASVPLLVGGFLELPLGVLAGQGRRRRLAILDGGVLFVLTLLGTASAGSFAVLMCTFVAFYPASGAFVSLTQAELMDARPDRQAQVMARWDLAGALGAVRPAAAHRGAGQRGRLAGRLPGAGRAGRAGVARRVPAEAGGWRGRGGGGPGGGGARQGRSGRGGSGSGRSRGRYGTGGRCAGCC